MNSFLRQEKVLMMKWIIAYGVLLILSIRSSGLAQGWEHLGPDSASWQYVTALSGR
jgi:hypothetical protein